MYIDCIDPVLMQELMWKGRSVVWCGVVWCGGVVIISHNTPHSCIVHQSMQYKGPDMVVNLVTYIYDMGGNHCGYWYERLSQQCERSNTITLYGDI